MSGSVGLRLFTLLSDSSNFVSWVGRHWLMSKHMNMALHVSLHIYPRVLIHIYIRSKVMYVRTYV